MGSGKKQQQFDFEDFEDDRGKMLAVLNAAQLPKRMKDVLRAIDDNARSFSFWDGTQAEIATYVGWSSERSVRTALRECVDRRDLSNDRKDFNGVTEDDQRFASLLSFESIGSRFIADPERRDRERRDTEAVFRFRINWPALALALGACSEAAETQQADGNSFHPDGKNCREDGKIFHPTTICANNANKRKQPAPDSASSSSQPSFNAAEAELPLDLDTPEFREKWREWCQYRQQVKRKPVSEAACKKQFAEFLNVGLDASIHAIDEAIKHDWQGLFPKKQQQSGKPSDSVHDWFEEGENGR